MKRTFPILSSPYVANTIPKQITQEKINVNRFARFNLLLL